MDAAGPTGSTTMTTVRGNKNWMAPELLAEDGATDVRYKRSIDVGSCALLIPYVCVNANGNERICNGRLGSAVKAGADILDRFADLCIRESPTKRCLLHCCSECSRWIQTGDVTVYLGPIIISTTSPKFGHIASHSLQVHAHTFAACNADDDVLLASADPPCSDGMKVHISGVEETLSSLGGGL